MLNFYLSIFCATLFLTLYLSRRVKRFADKDARLPPGPVGVPLLGYLPFLGVFNLGESFSKLADKYGDIFSISVGTQKAVVLNSYEAVKEAFSRADICDRPDTFMFRFFSHGERGIASASGDTWKVQRKFTHSALKKLGFNKTDKRFETHIQEEIASLIEVLRAKSQAGRTGVRISEDLNISVVNTIWALISGERRPRGDEILTAFIRSVSKCIELASTSGVLLFMPFLIKFLPERIFGVTEMRKRMKESHDYIDDLIQRHRIDFDPGRKTPKDFIDAFLTEQAKPDSHPSFKDKLQLLVLCSELFGAGGEPTSVTLKWALIHLARNPHIQVEAQKEIDAVVKSGPVCISDRDEMPYTQALVHDLIRLSDIHPIGVVHAPNEDVCLDGYRIPKGTFIFPNFHRIHRDKNLWERPERLHPGHFLDANGRFVAHRPGFLSFGVGPRQCPGRDMAKLELFLFVANLLQQFTFKLPEGERIESNPGVVVSPKPFKLILDSRC